MNKTHLIENFEYRNDVRQALLMEALILRVLRVAEVSHVHDVPRKSEKSRQHQEKPLVSKLPQRGLE